MKRVIFSFLISAGIFFFLRCSTDTTSIPAQENPELLNTPVVVNVENAYTFTLNGKEYTDNRQDEVQFSADSIVVTLTVGEFQNGTGSIVLTGANADTLLQETVNQSKVTVQTLSGVQPKRVHFDLKNFTGKLSFVVAGNHKK